MCVGGAKLYQHEREQGRMLEHLSKRVLELEAIIDSEVNYSATGYNYLAIGNSITVHAECDYWWNEIGMAATKAEKDYFHLVIEYLKSQNEEVVAYPYSFHVWEAQATDRAETLTMLNKYLDYSLDLVTIQLSENVRDLTTFKEDKVELINYIRERCPNAKIILIDEFWSDDKADLKQMVAEMCEVDLVDLAEIRNRDEYKCGMGTTVYGKDGTEHVVEHEGVAAHPNDLAYQYIADGIIDILKGL